MPLLLHAITLPPEGAVPTGGVRGGALLAADLDGITAWTTSLAADEPFTRTDLLDNHRVVTEVWQATEACLPARFPTWVEDITSLSTRRVALMQRLNALRGLCEVAITVAWVDGAEEEEVPATTPGRRYMARLAATQAQRKRAGELAAWLERLAEDERAESRRSVCPSPTIALSLALLVPRATAETVMARIPRSSDCVRILVNGPWPPYSFATLNPD